MSALDRILKYRYDQMMSGRDPGTCFVAVDETQALAQKAVEFLRYSGPTEENAERLTRLQAHAVFGNDPYALNGLQIFGMVLQVENSAQVAA